MKHNRLAAGILALTLALGMTACGEDSSADSTAATTEASTPASTEASAQGTMESAAATTEAAATEGATEGATEAATEAKADPKDAVLPTSYGDSYCKKFSERYSDDCATQNQTCHRPSERKFKAAEDEPQYIDYKFQEHIPPSWQDPNACRSGHSYFISISHYCRYCNSKLAFSFAFPHASTP